MAMLDLIQQQLKTFDEHVYYGVAANHPRNLPWNYTVFSRSNTDPSANLTGFTDDYAVAVVRENYIPEDALHELIQAMRNVPGLKLDEGQPIQYVYDVKSDKSVVEMMIVHFIKARKR